MAGIAHPHDRFFRALMASPRAADAFFRERLPPQLVDQLADSPPELVDGAFVDAQLRGSTADRLFRLRLRNGSSLFVYCLVEHKSTPEPRVALKLLRYQARIWEQVDRELGEGGILPPIVPMVLYHGAEPWTAPSSFSSLIEPSGALGVKLLDFEVVVVDLGEIDDARLSQDPALYAGLLGLKYARRLDRQRQAIRSILQALKRVPWLLDPGLTYIIQAYGPIDRAFLLGEVRVVMPEREQELMSIAAREWQAEWRAEWQKEALLHLMERRFGTLSDGTRARVAAGGTGEVEVWFDRAIDAESLGAVFGPTH